MEPFIYAMIAKAVVKGFKWLAGRSENELDDNIVDFVGDVVDVAVETDMEKLGKIKEIVKKKEA